MSRTVGVKFKDYGQVYYFDDGGYALALGDAVVVETEQGRGLARVASIQDDVPPQCDPEQMKPIFGPATDADFAQQDENDALARQAHRFCRERISERGLDMKLVEVEVFFDKSKVIFYFTAPGRVDFRELVKDLVREYRTRIELRQIGVRHETQMIGAVGNCGQLCCCRRFLRKFDPVTIKMAKEQNLFLNPTKISGICGRLLCCLGYEQHNYEEFQRRCPRIGRRFRTSIGMVKVLRSNFFRETLAVLTEEGEEREMTLDEWIEISSRSEPGGESPGQGSGAPAASSEPKAEPRTESGAGAGTEGGAEAQPAGGEGREPRPPRQPREDSGRRGPDRQGGRQGDRQSEGQGEGQSEHSADRQPDRQADRQGDRQGGDKPGEQQGERRPGQGRGGRGRRPRRRGGRKGGGGNKAES
ncbi:PSP1 domain protein [Desulfovibrio sp. X2]|uniref:PSP1 domain-containing protein n=1 Tax=Desulfovibrio sp. X2 TaxID=941449 RepID=UPI000358F372|nr:regulatory iron-sulfur-containing complex subunit RicT [Desulfovibrio sp. X2]EPR37466.1 PSP1 domain protein [Desulfovibrio sp. X2]